MQNTGRRIEELFASTREETVEELPLKVAPDWDERAAKAGKLARVIDEHVEFESKLQASELTPNTLCPEQKVSLASDVRAVVTGG